MKGSLQRIHFILCVLAALFAGCGGGTTGTDGGISTKFAGIVRDESGNVLAAVKITVLESGDSAVSDEEGRYELDTEIPGASAEFLFERQDFEARVKLSDLALSPDEDNTVAADFVIRIRSENIEVISATVNGVEIIAPPPPAPGASPAPEPTPEPEAEEPRSVVKGRVRDQTGAPLGGARVHIREGGRATRTKGDGTFRISIPDGRESITIVVRYQNVEGSVSIDSLPATPVVINLQLVLRLDGDDGDDGDGGGDGNGGGVPPGAGGGGLETANLTVESVDVEPNE